MASSRRGNARSAHDSYAGDSEPGQENGQGVGGTGFAMTPAGPGSGEDSAAKY